MADTQQPSPIDSRIARDARNRAEGYREGLEAAARVADDHTPEKHSGMTLQAHVTGRAIAAAIRALSVPDAPTVEVAP